MIFNWPRLFICYFFYTFSNYSLLNDLKENLSEAIPHLSSNCLYIYSTLHCDSSFFKSHCALLEQSTSRGLFRDVWLLQHSTPSFHPSRHTTLAVHHRSCACRGHACSDSSYAKNWKKKKTNLTVATVLIGRSIYIFSQLKVYDSSFAGHLWLCVAIFPVVNVFVADSFL